MAEQKACRSLRWDSSTRDETHPFPQRPDMFSSPRYNGVEVVHTYFPKTIKGTAYLRLPNSSKPKLWETNRVKSRFANRYTYQCPALQHIELPLSYLSTTVIEDHSDEKKKLEQGWCASNFLDGNRSNRFIAPPKERDYVILNKGKKGILRQDAYITPVQRVEREIILARQTKQQQVEAAKLTPMTLYQRADSPAVFKMSNASEWWNVDPVKVAKEQTALKDTLRKNPFSTAYMYSQQTQR